MYFGPPVTGVQNDDAKDVARAIFYFRRDVKTTTEYYLYSALSMIAEIGGYVGLLMGVSLFKLAEVNNFCLDFYATRQESYRLDEDRGTPVSKSDKLAAKIMVGQYSYHL